MLQLAHNPRINKAIHIMLMHGFGTLNTLLPGYDSLSIYHIYIKLGPGTWKLMKTSDETVTKYSTIL